MELTEATTQMDLTDVYRTFHPNNKEYTFFLAPHRIFPPIGHVLGQNQVLTDTEKNGINPCILSDHHGLKSEFNNNTNHRKSTNSWTLSSSQLNHHWIKEEIKK